MNILILLLLSLPASAEPDEDRGPRVVVEEREEIRGPMDEDGRPPLDDERGSRRMRRGPMGGMMMDPETREAMKRVMQLEHETKRLGRQAREDKNKKPELEKAVAELFDAKLALHEKKLERMKKELAGLEKQVRAGKTRRAELIKKRVDSLVGDGEEFPW